MKRDYREVIHKVNSLANDLDSIYHQAARKLGIADSVMFVCYMINEKGNGCLLHDICCECGMSKQTINSALRKLEKDDILYLKQDKGKTKRIFLTKKGEKFIGATAGSILEAEINAFSGWSDEEFEMHLKLMEKYNNALRKEINKMNQQL